MNKNTQVVINQQSLVFFCNVVICLTSLSLCTTASAQSTQAQLFGIRNLETSGYSGSSASTTSPNPTITSGFANGPVGISYLDKTKAFIEAGTVKSCDAPPYGCGDCKLHPYGSARDISGNYLGYGEPDCSVTFPNASTFNDFQVKYVGSNYWESYWWNGTQWKVLKRFNLGTGAAMPYVASGGESSGFTNPIGTITLKNNKFTVPGQAPKSWCYSSTLKSVSGSISSCSSTDYSWTVKFP